MVGAGMSGIAVVGSGVIVVRDLTVGISVMAGWLAVGAAGEGWLQLVKRTITMRDKVNFGRKARLLIKSVIPFIIDVKIHILERPGTTDTRRKSSR